MISGHEDIDELLEICCNLMSSIRHNWFKGHFEFGVKTLISEGMVTMVTKCEVLLYANSAKGRRLTSRLLIIDIHPKVTAPRSD